MSLVSGISSVEEMEGTLKAAYQQYLQNPTPANQRYLKDLTLAWKRNDWLELRKLKLLEYGTPLLAFEWKEVAHSKTAVTNGSTESHEFKVDSPLFIPFSLSYLIQSTTEFNVTSNQGITLVMYRQVDLDIIFEKTIQATPILIGAAYTDRNTFLLTPRRFQLGEDFTAGIINYTGQTIDLVIRVVGYFQ